MKRSLIVISMLMLAIGFLGCNYFQRKLSNEIDTKVEEYLRKSSDDIVAKVEQSKKSTGHLPEALPDIGLEEKAFFPCYCKTSNDSYMVWYPSLGQSDSYHTYISRTKQWSRSGGNASERGFLVCHFQHASC
jgi:hypothetical protein